MNQFKMMLLCVFLLSGCAGYRLKNRTNPFARYGVKSISIPTFLNRSVLPGVSAPFTKEVIGLLSRYPGLKVYTGERNDTDAVLVGTVYSLPRMTETIQTLDHKFTSGELADSIGSRNPFYLPISSNISLSLRLVLIKGHNKQIIDIARSDLAKHMKKSSKILFSEKIDVATSFTRQLSPTLTVDDGGVINFTKNRGILNSAIADLAVSATTTLEDVVLNAF